MSNTQVRNGSNLKEETWDSVHSPRPRCLSITENPGLVACFWPSADIFCCSFVAGCCFLCWLLATHLIYPADAMG